MKNSEQRRVGSRPVMVLFFSLPERREISGDKVTYKPVNSTNFKSHYFEEA